MVIPLDWNDPYVYVGIAGVICILFGLWRNSIGRWKNKSLMYELDTVVGASLVIIYQLHVHAYVTLPINLVLVFILFRGLTSYADRKKLRKELRRRK